MRVNNKLLKKIVILVLIIICGLIIFKPKQNEKIKTFVNENQNKQFAMYIKNDNKYEEYDGTKFPEGYDLDLNESKCIDNNGKEVNNILSYKNGAITVTSGKTTFCYLYFYLPEEKEFEYTGNYQVFIAPKAGEYQIELWGASGGDFFNTTYDTFGRGAYTKGTINLKKNEEIYIYVGENINDNGGNLTILPFNGGGPGETSGGGATDVRLEKGDWNNFDSLKSRIMVAAGGGGGTFSSMIDMSKEYTRGDGGALKGIDARFYCIYAYKDQPYGYSGHGATQTSGGEPGEVFRDNYDIDPVKTPEMTGTFGMGGYGIYYSKKYGSVYSSSGGGGGYYGGGHGNHPGSTWSGGGGGSSFISGHIGCVSIKEESTEENVQPKDGCTDDTTDIECSYHYSGKKFTKTEMKAGNEFMPTHDGQGTMEGNTGNGYAKIKLIAE